ncbi:flavodoxin [Eubacteriales bacterium OttesenSCG-928-M02]|nr:flavodoxin [Eubacteriales bacterium OttesenSCG-928-M02]
MSAKRNILVAYFSCSGVTENVAKTLAKSVMADVHEIKPEAPYTAADLNWNNPQSRSSLEMNNPSARPAIGGASVNLDKYDTIFLGFPIWWYVAPKIINTFLESYDFSDKTIVPFATSGGSGLGKTEENLYTSCSESTKWLPGKLLNRSFSEEDATAWINSLGLDIG